jgi:lysine 6-dehydrogenase
MYNYAVLGAGRQGQAIAYDLAINGDTKNISLIDLDEKIATDSANRLNKLLNSSIVKPVQLDVTNKLELKNKLTNINTVISAVPYFLNETITEVAIENKFNLVDLGGNTDIVRNQLSKNVEALSSKITITPDCGMGPGMNITLSLLVMEQFDNPKSIKIYDGGLPQLPKKPWKYNLFFNINGLTNEYDGNATFLRDSNLTEVECFEDIEVLNFDHLGELEAAVTSGGLSTMPWTFKNTLQTLENKTLRYEGHWQDMIAYRRLGLFDLNEIEFNNKKIIPREFYHHLLESKLNEENVKDVCIMRILGSGIKNGVNKNIQLDAVELYDDNTEFTAMEKWTGWHASIIAIHVTKSNLKGAIPVEKIMKGSEFLLEAKKRNFNITFKDVK